MIRFQVLGVVACGVLLSACAGVPSAEMQASSGGAPKGPVEDGQASSPEDDGSPSGPRGGGGVGSPSGPVARVPMPQQFGLSVCTEKGTDAGVLSVDEFLRKRSDVFGQRVRIRARPMFRRSELALHVECPSTNPNCQTPGGGSVTVLSSDGPIVLRNTKNMEWFECTQIYAPGMGCAMGIPQDQDVIVSGVYTTQQSAMMLQDAEVCLLR